MPVYTEFEGSTAGLAIRGYQLVPNKALLAKISTYTPEVVEAVLSEHPEIVDTWLKRLHDKYVASKRSCELENDPIARFNLLPLKQFEEHFQSWKDDGIIRISLPEGRDIRIKNTRSKKEEWIGSQIAPTDQAVAYPHFVCSTCSAVFADSEQYSRHRIHEAKMKKKKLHSQSAAKKRIAGKQDVPPNPIWWLYQSRVHISG
jgi:hypothetical protein